MSQFASASISTPAPPSRRTILLSLLAVLIACAPPLFVRLGTRESTHTMENIALLSSQETWHRIAAGEKGAWLLPTNNGELRIRKPPLLVWLNLLAWSDLDPASCDPALLVYRSRLVSASLALVMIAAIFWLGLTLADLKMAVLASLAAGTTIFLQHQGRTASYDVHMAAWTTAAVAAALWAMQPFRAAPTRGVWVGGWALCGLFTAAAFMSKSPLGPALVVLPALAAMLLDRSRWRSNLLGLVVALVIMAILIAPWIVYAFTKVPNARHVLSVEYEAARSSSPPFYYYLGVFALVAPWTLWLIAGLFQPFVRASGQERRLRLIAWLWFVLIFVAFSLHPEAKQQRYILPIVASAALLAAQVWWDHERLARAGRPDSGGFVLARAHWIALLVVSLAAGFFLAQPQRMVDWHWADTLPITAMPWPMALLVGVAATALSLLGWRWHLGKQLVWRAGLATAAWAVVVTTAFWSVYASAPNMMTLVVTDAHRVTGIIHDRPLRYLLNDEKRDTPPEEEFRFYTSRIIPLVRTKELKAYAADGSGPVYVLARDEDSHREVMNAAGFTSLGKLREGLHKTGELWSSQKQP